MALQGDLTSFALPDVLRLLAGTGKSGLLEVTGSVAAGELLLRQGGLQGGALSSSPATATDEVLFELLRFDQGAFAFVEGEPVGEGPVTDVDAALGAAEALLAEWTEVELVVPSMDAWVLLADELVGEGVHVSAAQWRAVAAVGGGGNVRDLAAALGVSDLDACRTVRDLAESGLVEVRASHAAVTPSVQLDDFEAFEPLEGYDVAVPAGEPVRMTELEDLVVEDRPVVMEESDDALLPEPLPGEGVAYDGSDLTGIVDGRSMPMASSDHAADVPLDDAAAAFAAFEGYDAVEPMPPVDQGGDEAAAFVAPELDPSMEAVDDVAPFGDEQVDDERGSLLKFLSTVKP